MEQMYYFQIGDRVEQYMPNKGFRSGTIVDKILPLTKPDMDLIRKYQLTRLPITKATVQRWIVRLEHNPNLYYVFPENPKRRIADTIHLVGDVTITLIRPKYTPPPKPQITQIIRPL